MCIFGFRKGPCCKRAYEDVVNSVAIIEIGFMELTQCEAPSRRRRVV